MFDAHWHTPLTVPKEAQQTAFLWLLEGILWAAKVAIDNCYKWPMFSTANVTRSSHDYLSAGTTSCRRHTRLAPRVSPGTSRTTGHLQGGSPSAQ